MRVIGHSALDESDVHLEGRIIQIPDVEQDPEYTWTEAQKLGGFRTLLGVPLLRAGTPVGVFKSEDRGRRHWVT